ncbi:MAG: ferritin-like domain-containing protein [Roseiarcus sp.]
MTAEPDIHVGSREELIYLLAEAAEIEHNLMCCYLFAASGLKDETDALTGPQAAEVGAWRRAIVGVAVEEMTHLALVANLTLAIGGSPHFGRPNFPVARGYHPSGVIVELRRFDRATLDHFIYLERPEGVEIADGAGFNHFDAAYVRDMGAGRLMPSAQDYAAVGHLYRSIRRAIEAMCGDHGEAAIFVGDPALQVGPDLVSLPGLVAVTDEASALRALDTIVEQGEGSPADVEYSHYRRFVAIRDAYEGFLAASADFDPSRAVAPNPVMRKPPSPEGKTLIDDPIAAAVLDLANAIYGAMLRSLAQGFAEREPPLKRAFIDTAIDGMFAFAPIARYLTQLPASPAAPGLRAGMSFAMLRDVAPLPEGESAVVVLGERLRQLADGAKRILDGSQIGAECAATLARLADRLDGMRAQKSPSQSQGGQATATEPDVATQSQAQGVETAEGRDIVIEFAAERCIHARFCVLGQPGVFKANVVGPWIAPDDATSAEGLVAVAQNCPSGAIRYRRKDGGPEESAPPVNLIQIRENGPLAFRGALIIDGQPINYRATLCRCGQSQNKPYCDGSHKAAEFVATGEPATGDVTPLAARGGEVSINPQPNGPLAVTGNLELISGTGRTFRKAQQVRLCRCGASANKPFCDGSHARVRFRS